MQWLTIVLMILKLLKQAKAAESQEQFVASVQASNSPLAANGAILQWFWDHREELIAFIMAFFAQPNVFHAPPAPGVEASVESEEVEEAEALALVEELKS